jgi:hypothetical protein
MFASAREIVHGANLLDLTPYDMPSGSDPVTATTEVRHQAKLNLLKDKYAAAQTGGPSYQRGRSTLDDHGAGVAESISQRGYDWSEPIHIHVKLRDKENPLTVKNGHHRLAVMYHTAPDEPIPLMVTEADDNHEHGGLDNLTAYGVRLRTTLAPGRVVGAFRRMGQERMGQGK